jgi:hypothetical protein
MIGAAIGLVSVLEEADKFDPKNERVYTQYLQPIEKCYVEGHREWQSSPFVEGAPKDDVEGKE